MTINYTDLKSQYNPEGSQLRNAQKRMLEMLIFLDEVCQKNNIPYWLDCGTLLGAVRHKGFIPWDDDVDIGMMRKDIPKFIKAVEQEKKTTFVMQTRKTDSGFMQDWPVLRDLNSEYIQPSKVHIIRKYRGLQIDIFPFEYGISSYLWGWTRFFNEVKIRFIEKDHLKIAKVIDRTCKNLIYPLWRLIKFNKIVSYDYGIPGPQQQVENKILFPLQKVSFEGRIFNAPNNSHLYLKSQYGADYMVVPPIEKRSIHTSQIIIH